MSLSKNPLLKSIGSRIAYRRKLMGLKGKELAERMGCHPPDITDWEKSKNIPSVESLIKLARALETTETWLVSGQIPDTKRNDEGKQDRRQLPVDTRGGESDNSLTIQWEHEMIQDKNQIIELQKEKIRGLEARLAKLEEEGSGTSSKKLAG
jgi:transcriptional regulator with XRE-family HTH domain